MELEIVNSKSLGYLIKFQNSKGWCDDDDCTSLVQLHIER